MKKGAMLPLSIDTVAFGGQGVGRHNDLVVFVPLMVDGDEGIVEIVDVKKRYVLGRLKELTKPSLHRTLPRCSAYGRCGGCRYQHIAYDHQLALKKGHVYDAFSRIGKFPHIPLAEVMPSPSPWHYRSKAEFHISRKSLQEIAIGFTRAASHEIQDIEECIIVDPTINAALATLREKECRAKGKRIDGKEVLWSSADGETEAKGLVSRTVKGRKMLIPRRGFFQANRLLADTLVDIVLEKCALTGSETVLDGYCGSGFFSLFLAPKSRMFYGIEFVGDAVRAADLNLREAGIDHALFYEGDIGHIIAEAFVKAGQGVDVLVLDPPRIGLDPPVLSAIARLKPSRIVYVSCNPSTMARDVRFLADHGYSLEMLQPIDMFPQTSHIEVVGLLTKTPQ